jgi:ribosomal protein S18 acetylase RimI-like enzyme
MKIKFRAVKSNDWLLIKEIYLDMFNDHPEEFGEPAQSILQRGTDQWKRFTNVHARMLTSCAYLALRGTDICGFVRCTTIDERIPPGTAMISNLWVNPIYRQRGVGTTLINLALTWTRWRNVSMVTIGVTAANRNAVGYCENFGFFDMGRRLPNPQNPEEAIIVMGKKLG